MDVDGGADDGEGEVPGAHGVAGDGEERPGAGARRRAVRWYAATLLVLAATLAVACGTSPRGDGGGDAAAPDAAASPDATTVDPELTGEDFKPLSEMTPVRGFFVDNVLGDVEAAVAVAESPDGGTYPVGTVIQLVPQEAMVKRAPGFSPEFGDWEFFELDVSPEGTTIVNRGDAEIVNRFGMSCADCHAMAEPQWDLVCEQDHGCDPIPLTRSQIVALQDGDPRPVTP